MFNPNALKKQSARYKGSMASILKDGYEKVCATGQVASTLGEFPTW